MKVSLFDSSELFYSAAGITGAHSGSIIGKWNLFLPVLGFELMASFLLGRHSTT
jgi:hypothetical protein